MIEEARSTTPITDKIISDADAAPEGRVVFLIKRLANQCKEFERNLTAPPAAEVPDRWIPVGVLLPDGNEKVAVVYCTGAVDAREAGKVRRLWETREPGEDCAISYWRALPAAPSAPGKGRA